VDPITRYDITARQRGARSPSFAIELIDDGELGAQVGQMFRGKRSAIGLSEIQRLLLQGQQGMPYRGLINGAATGGSSECRTGGNVGRPGTARISASRAGDE